MLQHGRRPRTARVARPVGVVADHGRRGGGRGGELGGVGGGGGGGTGPRFADSIFAPAVASLPAVAPPRGVAAALLRLLLLLGTRAGWLVRLGGGGSEAAQECRVCPVNVRIPSLQGNQHQSQRGRVAEPPAVDDQFLTAQPTASRVAGTTHYLATAHRQLLRCAHPWLRCDAIRCRMASHPVQPATRTAAGSCMLGSKLDSVSPPTPHSTHVAGFAAHGDGGGGEARTPGLSKARCLPCSSQQPSTTHKSRAGEAILHAAAV
jgi:hypothetical protein